MITYRKLIEDYPMKMVRKVIMLTGEQATFLEKKAEKLQMNKKRLSPIVRQIIQAKMDEEKAKEKKEE